MTQIDPQQASTGRQFPADFYWGASTASHQVEGNTTTQWDEWERKNAATGYARNKRGLGHTKRWPEIATLAEDPNTYLAGQAIDHYNRYADDFDLVKHLNMNAMRFSIEWSRIEPRPGEWDEREIEHYRTYIQTMRSKGIEPFMTLWHFTLPIWFDKIGGFSSSRNLDYYERYVEKIMSEFGSLVRFVIPVNEPNTFITLGYLQGHWPPQRHNPFVALATFRNLVRAHSRAYAVIKKYRPDAQVGCAMAISNDSAGSRSPIAGIVRYIVKKLWNQWYLDGIKNCQDFVGVNYYMSNTYSWFGGWNNPKTPRSDLDWYMDPAGIYNVLAATYKRYQKPLYITENGLADAHDQYRTWWLEQTIGALQRALDDGIDVRGYLHWSLLDNFEWASGWLANFGLIGVDRKTLQRKIRPSAEWFGEQIKGYRHV